MTVNGRELRKCCEQDPLLHMDTPKSSYAVFCEKCRQRAVGLTILGAVEQWNNKEVLEGTETI